MPMDSLKTPVGMAKCLSILLGLAIIVMAFWSYFDSSWYKLQIPDMNALATEPDATMRLHDMCRHWDAIREGFEQEEEKKCPNVALENFFLSVVSISFFVSVLSLVFSLKIVTNVKSKAMRANDMGFHAVFAILLVISGAFYLVSAQQIYKLYDEKSDDELSEIFTAMYSKDVTVKMHKLEKIVASGLAFGQAALFLGITGLYIKS